MDHTLIIKQARDEDGEAVSALLVSTFAHLYDRLNLTMSAERRAYLTDHAGRRAYAQTLLCEVDGMMAGTITLVPPGPKSNAWLDGAWEIRLLAISPGMQGRGIARQLLLQAEARAREGGAVQICLHARQGMEAQAHLYPSAGYRRDPAGDMAGPPYQEAYVKALGA